MTTRMAIAAIALGICGFASGCRDSTEKRAAEAKAAAEETALAEKKAAKLRAETEAAKANWETELRERRDKVALTRVKVNVPRAGNGPSFEELVDRLQDSDFGVRFKALSYIGAMKPYPKEIAPHVIHLLKDPNYNIRSNAAEALGNLQNALPNLGTRFPECVPQLILMLSDRDPEDKHQLVRRCAAYALRHLGASSKAAVPDLLKIAANKSEIASVRSEAVQALGEIGHASPEVVAALTKLLDDPARINENYPTIGSTAKASPARLKK